MNADKELVSEILNMLGRRHTILLGEYKNITDTDNNPSLYRDLRMKKSGQIDEVNYLRREMKKALVAQGILL